MNIIKTVADLKKALSAYNDNLPLAFFADGFEMELNNCTQICEEISEQGSELVISLNTKKVD